MAEIYGKTIKIIQSNDFKIDRSLDSSRFREVTGFRPLAWPELIKSMYEFK